MLRIRTLVWLTGLLAASSLGAQARHAGGGTPAAHPAANPAPVLAPTGSPRPYFLGGFFLGYNGGKTVDGSLTAGNLFGAFPLRLRAGLRFSYGNGGEAQAARHAFINDATNGTPEDHGKTWGVKLDFLYPVGLLPGHNTQAYVGFRHANFTGTYRLVGANEEFNVTSSNWGFGGGLETQYPVSRSVSINLTAGLDYFIPSRLYGHDTAYTPSGSNQVNPRAGFSYSDADKAVAQPKLSPVMMAGLQFRL